MKIYFHCNKCNTKYVVDDMHARKKAKCKNCGSIFFIPIEDSMLNKKKMYHHSFDIFILLIICLLTIGYGIFFSKNMISNFGYLFGYNLVIALMPWAIYLIIIGKRKSKNIQFISYSCILISLIIANYIGYYNQIRYAKAVVVEIQKTVTESIVNFNNADNQPSFKRIRINTNPKIQGDYGVIEIIFKDLIDQMYSQRQDYVLELNAIEWDRILDPSRLENDFLLIESSSIIKRARNIVEKYKSHTHDLLQLTRNNISSSKINIHIKDWVLNGWDKGMINASLNISVMWSYEERIVNEVENAFLFLAEKRSQWYIENSKIVFSNDDDLYRFNKFLNKIKNIAAQQEAIRNQSIASVTSNFSNLLDSKHGGHAP